MLELDFFLKADTGSVQIASCIASLDLRRNIFLSLVHFIMSRKVLNATSTNQFILSSHAMYLASIHLNQYSLIKANVVKNCVSAKLYSHINSSMHTEKVALHRAILGRYLTVAATTKTIEIFLIINWIFNEIQCCYIYFYHLDHSKYGICIHSSAEIMTINCNFSAGMSLWQSA